MLKEHKAELANLKMDYLELLDAGEDTPFSLSLFALIEGRISDLESMIFIDERIERQNGN
jgi:type IV secretory pathway VirB4 component